MADSQETPQIHVDSDWKAQAQAEKQRIAKQAKAAETEGSEGKGASAGSGGLPPASFETLISTMVTQALFAMGAIQDPRTGKHMQQLDLARHHIDMLSVIEEKTKGNLTTEESKMLNQTLYELRSRYIQTTSASRPV